MPEVVEAPAPEVIVPTSEPRRFEIPSFTEKKADAEPVVEAPKADLPPATEVKPTEATADPEAERASKARADKLKINRLYKQAAEEKAKRELAEKELEKYRQPVAPQQGAPNPADFSDINEFTKAVRQHERTEAIKEYEQQKRVEADKVHQQRLADNWNAQTDKGAEKYEDFETVVGDIKPTTAWAIAIMQSENGADVAYYLGKNMKEVQRIFALDNISQIREIGKIEAKLLATPPTLKPASKAPAPIIPVSGSAQTDTTLTDDMPYEKFLKVRSKQLGRT